MRGPWVAVLWAAFSFPALAQHNHPSEHAEIHDKFYSTWMRPDMPNSSCCDKKDCYPTEARRRNGNWYALRREDRQWILVPPAKIELNRDSPDGRNHLCAPPPVGGDVPFCFIAGGGT